MLIQYYSDLRYLIQILSVTNYLKERARLLKIYGNMILMCESLRLTGVFTSTPVQPPGTLPSDLMTLLIRVHSENNSRMYFLIVHTTDYCWRSWTSRIAAPYKSRVD